MKVEVDNVDDGDDNDGDQTLKMIVVMVVVLMMMTTVRLTGADLGGGCRGCATPPPSEMTRCFLIQLVFCKKKKTMWFIGVEVEQETSAPPPEKNPGSAPG